MNNSELKHSLFEPQYVAKVGRGRYTRYFYSQREYQRYLQQQRENAIAKTNEKAAEQRKAEKERKSRAAERKAEERKKQQERENAIAKTNAKAAEQRKAIEEAKKVPDKVSLKDYLFGGEYLKHVRGFKKLIKKNNKILEDKRKQSEKLLKKLESLEKRKGKSTYDRDLILKYKKEYKELRKEISDVMHIKASASENYSIALCRYESATLLGSIRKTGIKVSDKASRIINKFVREPLSKITNAPIINTKKG